MRSRRETQSRESLGVMGIPEAWMEGDGSWYCRIHSCGTPRNHTPVTLIIIHSNKAMHLVFMNVLKHHHHHHHLAKNIKGNLPVSPNELSKKTVIGT